MRDVSGIAEEIQGGVPEILALWQDVRGKATDEDFQPRFLEAIGQALIVFTAFLQSSSPLEEFSREGATRELVEEIAGYQRAVGRDTVGVIEDYAALRRCVWRFIGDRADLSDFDSGELLRFFGKFMQASDWVTGAGLAAFDRITRREMESALGRAAVTDLLTGLPDRDLFNRRLLPLAIEDYELVALVVFDVVGFSGTVASGEIGRAREALIRLTEAVGEVVPEEAVRVRFGDDEICAILPELSAEDAYRLAEEVLIRLANGPEELQVDAGIAVYPEHGLDAGEIVGAAMAALNMAKRVGGSGIVVAQTR